MRRQFAAIGSGGTYCIEYSKLDSADPAERLGSKYPIVCIGFMKKVTYHEKRTITHDQQLT